MTDADKFEALRAQYDRVANAARVFLAAGHSGDWGGKRDGLTDAIREADATLAKLTAPPTSKPPG